MRTVLTTVTAVGLLASAVGAADVVKPAAASTVPEVHKMVILNGPTTTVHYFSVGLSISDETALRDLERAENDAAYADDLQALRRIYTADELLLAPYRAVVQQGLYGRSITRDYSRFLTGAGYGPGSYGYPYSYGSYFNGYGAYMPSFASSSSVVNQSLANGVGDEGALKTAMAPVIASQAGAEYGAAAHAYTTAMNRVGDSESLRTAMNVNPRGGVVAAANVQTRRATLLLKSGEKVDGAVTHEDDDWVTVDNGTDEVSVRKADVVRIDRHKK